MYGAPCYADTDATFWIHTNNLKRNLPRYKFSVVIQLDVKIHKWICIQISSTFKTSVIWNEKLDVQPSNMLKYSHRICFQLFQHYNGLLRCIFNFSYLHGSPKLNCNHVLKTNNGSSFNTHKSSLCTKFRINKIIGGPNKIRSKKTNDFCLK